MRTVIPALTLFLALSLTAFGGTPLQNPPPPPTPDLRPSRPVVLTGTITQLRTAVNGDYSGWILIKPERTFNLNVTAVLAQARALHSQRVVIHGFLTTGNFADGTPFQQVRVTSIVPAP